jgi:hypothetical protein
MARRSEKSVATLERAHQAVAGNLTGQKFGQSDLLMMLGVGRILEGR